MDYCVVKLLLYYEGYLELILDLVLEEVEVSLFLGSFCFGMYRSTVFYFFVEGDETVSLRKDFLLELNNLLSLLLLGLLRFLAWKIYY
jgi:hypothetical protein